MLVECLEVGEPLTAEEAEEKDQLLEEVGKFLYELGFDICIFSFNSGIW
jgi:hypothetical protein